MNRTALFIGLCLAAAAPAMAQTVAAPVEPAAAPAKPQQQQDKVKCRMVAPVGSLVPKRECMTVRQEADQRREADLMINRPQPSTSN